MSGFVRQDAEALVLRLRIIGGRGVQGVIFTLELDSGNLAGELAIGTCSGHLVARHRQSDNAVERRSVEVLVHEHTTAPIGDAEITDHATALDAITRLALWTIKSEAHRVGKVCVSTCSAWWLQ